MIFNVQCPSCSVQAHCPRCGRPIKKQYDAKTKTVVYGCGTRVTFERAKTGGAFIAKWSFNGDDCGPMAGMKKA